MSLSKYKLSDLTEGTSAKITSIEIDGVMRRRLLDLGFVPGNVVTVIKKSPLGDPVAFRVSGTVIALRKEESSNIYGEMIG
ncbi:ferrous iron transport protein A [Rossellomorea aquimaris]|uniref:FeoA family protein n=1 Tax=Rossellomorea aquimaris TaxID=189382 RepID=UPI001CD5254A|nr:FeoA family protein [Rossellomorea aquimaris]MCA1053758.1 ferrous iron transport protein A [Rossellomorea aquimaris]